MINYINFSFGDIITPAKLKSIFEHYSPTGTTPLSEEDFKRIIYNEFKRYQINLTEEGDKLRFRGFLSKKN
jgi:hypothetical protein